MHDPRETSGPGAADRGDLPPAVVVGLCAHGLAVCRSLARRNVRVHAIEADRSLPGVLTSVARVHMVADVNGEGLVPALVDLARSLGGARPVLILTNDRMVRRVAAGWRGLEDHYRLSWGASAETVERFLSKTALEAHCRAHGLGYPATTVLSELAGLRDLDGRSSFPLVVKPAMPLSGFKVKLVQSEADLEALVREHVADLPFLLQQWIPGDDRAIRVCCLYLDRGQVLAGFEGRKLRSLPPAFGGATMMDSFPDAEVRAETLRFFEGLDISGPAALELKRAPDGSYWVIEPTLGRTDYFVACSIENGVDLPYVEYCHQAGLPLGPSLQSDRAVWVDTERDPLGLMHEGATLARAVLRGKRLAWPYSSLRDWKPSARSWLLFFRRGLERLARRVRRLFGRG